MLSPTWQHRLIPYPARRQVGQQTLDPDPGGPGYKRILIHPRPGGTLTHARASLDSPHGRIELGWSLSDGEFQLDVTLPPNTRGVVRLPAQSAEAVTEGGQSLAQAEGITRIAAEDGGLAVHLGAGRYSFRVTAQVRTL